MSYLVFRKLSIELLVWHSGDLKSPGSNKKNDLSSPKAEAILCQKTVGAKEMLDHGIEQRKYSAKPPLLEPKR
jgi:hypothetical protein